MWNLAVSNSATQFGIVTAFYNRFSSFLWIFYDPELLGLARNMLLLVSCLVLSFTEMMEVICFSEQCDVTAWKTDFSNN